MSSVTTYGQLMSGAAEQLHRAITGMPDASAGTENPLAALADYLGRVD